MMRESREIIDSCMKTILLNRRACELTDENVEKFDSMVDESYHKWSDAFDDMDIFELMSFMLVDMMVTKAKMKKE